MSSYTYDELIKRNNIIQSHKLIGEFLDRYSVNNLIILFNNKIINRYIEDERRAQLLDSNDITIICDIYGENKDNFSMYIGVMKNNIDFIHLSIHLRPNDLNAKNHGMIHFCKDIFIQTIKKGSSLSARKLKSIINEAIYAPVSIHRPIDKPNTLQFSIDDNYKITNLENAQ